MTSSDTATDLVRRYYAALNARDWAAYDELLTPDTELAAPGAQDGDGFLRLRGVDAVRGFDQIWATAADDFTVEPLETVADDAGVVLSRNRVSMTHTGTLHTPMGDVPATGARIDSTYVGTFRVQDGRIAVQQIYYDQMMVALRLGMVPTPA